MSGVSVRLTPATTAALHCPRPIAPLALCRHTSDDEQAAAARPGQAGQEQKREGAGKGLAHRSGVWGESSRYPDVSNGAMVTMTAYTDGSMCVTLLQQLRSIKCAALSRPHLCQWSWLGRAG